MLIAASAFSPTLGRVPKRRDTIEVLTRHHQDATSHLPFLGHIWTRTEIPQHTGYWEYLIGVCIQYSEILPASTNDFLLAVLPMREGA